MGTQHGTHMLYQFLGSQSAVCLAVWQELSLSACKGCDAHISDVPPLISGNMRPMIARSKGPRREKIGVGRSRGSWSFPCPFRANAVVVLRQ